MHGHTNIKIISSLTATTKTNVFWDVASCFVIEMSRPFNSTMLTPSLLKKSDSSTQNTTATNSSEMLLSEYQITRRHVYERGNIRNVFLKFLNRT